MPNANTPRTLKPLAAALSGKGEAALKLAVHGLTGDTDAARDIIHDAVQAGRPGMELRCSWWSLGGDTFATFTTGGTFRAAPRYSYRPDDYEGERRVMTITFSPEVNHIEVTSGRPLRKGKYRIQIEAAPGVAEALYEPLYRDA